MRGSGAPDLDSTATPESPATLVAQLPLVVIDISTGGCLFESHRPVDVGRVGTVRLALNGRWYVEGVRVMRCDPVPGGTTFHIGAEFIGTRRLPDQSLRLAVGRMSL
jgi:hypothetical protein